MSRARQRVDELRIDAAIVNVQLVMVNSGAELVSSQFGENRAFRWHRAPVSRRKAGEHREAYRTRPPPVPDTAGELARHPPRLRRAVAALRALVRRGRSKPGRDPLGDAGFDPAFRVDQRVGAEPLDRRRGRQDGSRATAGLDEPARRSPPPMASRSRARARLCSGATVKLAPQASQPDGGSGRRQAEYAASNSSFQKANSSLFWSSRPNSRASPKNPGPAFPLTTAPPRGVRTRAAIRIRREHRSGGAAD